MSTTSLSNRLNISPMFRLAVVGATALLAACATVPKNAGFNEVQSDVSPRLEQKLRWNQDAQAGNETGSAVHQLLQTPLTPERAVQVALLNNPSLQADYEQLGIAQADLVQAGLLNNITVSGQWLSSSVETEKDFGVTANILNLLTRGPRKNIQSAVFASTKLAVSNKVLELAADVKVAYYTAQADAQEVALFTQAVAASEAAAELAQRQYQAGTLNRREQLLQQSFYAQTLLDAAQAETRLQTDREHVNRLLGLWGNNITWTLPARLPAPKDIPKLEHLESQAIAQRLDLAVAKQEESGIYYALNYSRRYRFLGPLSLGFDIQKTSDRGTLRGPQVEFGLPLFDQGQPRIARLESEQRAAERRVEALAIAIRSQVREARTKLIAADHAVSYYQSVILPLQEQITKQTELFYNGMLVGVYDLLTAKQNEINAARSDVDALRDYWIARSELERTIGGHLILTKDAESAPAPPHVSWGKTQPDQPARLSLPSNTESKGVQ